jgi:mannose-1-phosphate guanylyltransferase/phosphomannomutase
MVLVDETGKVYDDVQSLIIMTALLLNTGRSGAVVVPVSAPSVIELLCREKECPVRRVKNSERAIIESSLADDVIMAGTMDGRFSFPSFQSAFDGMFAIAKTMELLAEQSVSLSSVIAGTPHRAFLRWKVACALEMKGGIMRRMSEDSTDRDASFIDGIRVNFGEEWVLVLPDQYQPNVQIVAEAKEQKSAQRLLDEYRIKVEAWKKELAQ